LQVVSVDVGNPASNVIPAEARALFNIRFNDHHSGASLSQWLHERAQAQIDGKAAYKLEIQVSGESFLTAPGPLSEMVAASVEKTSGRKPELSTTGGTSDARFIKDYCPVVEFGATGQTMHKVDERIALADLAQLTDIYADLLQRFFATG
jgi:succinyl-diaminopimelate desuccinylase